MHLRFSCAYRFLLKTFVVLLFSVVASCVSVPEHDSEKRKEIKRFKVDRGTAWEALVLAFKPYPVKNISQDSGVIETERMRHRQVWKPVHSNKKQSGFYKLKAILTYKEGYAYVSVEKIIRRQKDFFSKTEILPSDFLEEQTLLYRMKREIQIKKLIRRLYKSG